MAMTMTMAVSQVIFLFSLLVVTVAQTEIDIEMISCSDTAANYTANSTFSTNLKTLFSSLSSHNDITSGFYNFSTGKAPDAAYAYALCRGDLIPQDCRACIANTTSMLLQACPYQKQAFGWFQRCMIRYSDESMYGVRVDDPVLDLFSTAMVSNVTLFNEKLKALLDGLRDKAAAGDSLRKIAMGSVTITPMFKTLYAISQCTPDLSQIDCVKCLDGALERIPVCCNGADGARVTRGGSCYFRYETYLFYQPPAGVDAQPDSPTSSSGTTSSGKKSNLSRIIIIVVVPIAIVVALAMCVCVYFRVRKARRNAEIGKDISNVESLQLDFNTLRAATDNFSDANKLGQGGFGAVYKGRFQNGQDIAVKRLSMDSGQGETEFKNEVLLVAKLQHRNLVRLLGFCLDKNERLLVYEFVTNSSLDHYIYDPIKRAQLDWETRCKIIGGIARGLLYLHEDSRLMIIHRDLKAGNILLDAQMTPKIADFGMAKLVARDQTQQDATRRVVGTYGYMAPEYVFHGNFSVKSDVFSFGVLLLETIAGQKNSCFRNGETMEDLKTFAWKSWREGTAINLVDETMRESGSRSEMLRCIHVGLLCVQENQALRPTMATVMVMLNSNSVSLPVPSQPAFLMHSVVDEPDRSEQRSDSVSANEATITELSAR